MSDEHGKNSLLLVTAPGSGGGRRRGNARAGPGALARVGARRRRPGGRSGGIFIPNARSAQENIRYRHMGWIGPMKMLYGRSGSTPRWATWLVTRPALVQYPRTLDLVMESASPM
jgi:hypothetical protein